MPRPLIVSDDETRAVFDLAKTGNADALNQLLGLFRPALHPVGRPFVPAALQAKVASSDLVQTTLWEAFQAFPEFRGQTVPEFWAWLRAVHRNNARTAVRFHRQDTRNAGQEVGLEGEVADAQAGEPAGELMDREADALRRRAFAMLTADDQAALRLKESGLDYAALAGRLGVTVLAARQRCSRAMRAWLAQVRKLGAD